MSREKNKNNFGSFRTKKNFFANKKQKLISAMLFLIFISGGGIWIYKKINPAPKEQAVVASADSQEIPSWWLREYFGNGICEEEACQPTADPDLDKLTNTQEFYYHTEPLNKDTNGNGATDGEDVAAGIDPLRTGNLKFDEIENDDTALLESLVFDKDIVQMVGEMATLNNITAPEISDAEIQITSDNTKESILKYLHDSNVILQKYFPQGSGDFIGQMMNEQSSESLTQVASAAIKASAELRGMKVPSDAVAVHKYQLGLMKLLPEIIFMPNSAEASDLTNEKATRWYDSVRTFSYVYQQISIETVKLQNKYNN